MRAQARIALAVCLLLAAALPAPAATRFEFDSVVDFSVSLKSLAAAAAGEASLPSGRLFVLDGTVSDLTVLDKEQGSFRARIELISGEWIGTEDVKSYACLIDFSGPGFFKMFPARAPRDPSPDMVFLNSRVLVVARPIGLTTSHQGEKRVQLEGIYVRVIK
jgi:hypothetical protein